MGDQLGRMTEKQKWSGLLGWRRIGGLAGVVFAVLVLVGVLLAPVAPSIQASGDEILLYLHSNQEAVTTGYYMGVLAVVFGVLFFGVLTATLLNNGVDETGALVALGAIILTGAVVVMQAAVVGGPLVTTGGSLDADDAAALWGAMQTSFMVVALLAGVSGGLFGWVLVRMQGTLWKIAGALGLVALLAGAVNFLMSWAQVDSDISHVVAWGTFLFWSAITGVVMLVAKEQVEETAEAEVGAAV